jgi:hypothetical protein
VRTFVGGAAVGALLGVAALQLSTLLREPEPVPARSADAARAPVAYVAERPARRGGEAPTASSSARRSPHAAPSASVSSAPEPAVAPTASAPAPAPPPSTEPAPATKDAP